MLFSFPLAGLVIHSIKETNYEDEEVVYAADVQHDLEKPAPAVEQESSSIDKVKE